jgi:hypothetical protein
MMVTTTPSNFSILPFRTPASFSLGYTIAVAYDSLNGDQLGVQPCAVFGDKAHCRLDTWESPTDYTDNPNDTFEIDPQTGDITWNTPLVAGEYNVAFMVEEFRNGVFRRLCSDATCRLLF